MNNYHSVKIKPVKIFKILMAIVIVLLICHIVGYLHKVKVGEGVITYSFEPLFNLDYENTVPSFFSSLILILAALILMSIASDPQTSSYRRHWWILSIIFIYLAFDEFCGFHEILTMPVRNRIDLSGWIYHVP